MLQDEVPGSRFLDLFSGSGGIGIEALSRGAKYCVFVDNDKESADCISYNLSHTHLEDRGMLIKRDVFSALGSLTGQKPFDIVFMDPPYNTGIEFDVLNALYNSSLVHDDTLFVIEASIDTDFFDAQRQFIILKEKIYKTNKHVYLVMKPE